MSIESLVVRVVKDLECDTRTVPQGLQDGSFHGLLLLGVDNVRFQGETPGSGLTRRLSRLGEANTGRKKDRTSETCEYHFTEPELGWIRWSLFNSLSDRAHRILH